MTSFGPADGSVQRWKVGALSQSTGLSVRTLRYYDEIGLLWPSGRSDAGHRLYDGADVARLYRICLLRRLGFPLDRIAAVLEDPQWQLAPAVTAHLAQTRDRAAIAARLCARLAAMSAALGRQRDPTPRDLFATLEEMTMLDHATIRGTTGLLVYDDVERAQEYIVRVFGLTPGELTRDANGRANHGEVRAGDQVIYLHPSGDAYRSPNSLGAVSGMTVVTVDDADAHYASSLAAGADIIEEPESQPYGVREWGARDPEGQLWYFHSPLD
ncbi:MAG TPA: MerR family transcriptional regulator [Streptosporangiaceae bacterium]|jgi:DNA-binding transcriptional MerR regulator